tara:strand:+ start:104629 stop:107469 length:2841 start_codon:yes stop_codon:yes gene_type:complete
MGKKDTYIEIEGAKVHNLKNINLKIPREKLVVITGLSGSGKSSLAFDTIYSEGQRRYLETFSAYVRQFLGNFERPNVEKIDGLSPVIAIEQKTTSKNPRSTVGTITEIYDFLRLLYSRIGIAFSHISNKKMISFSEESVIEIIKSDFLGKNLYILSPVVRSRKGHYRELFESLSKQGFTKVRVDGNIVDLKPGLKLDRYKNHDIEILIDRVLITKNETSEKRLKESIQTAFYHGKNTILIIVPDKKIIRYFSRNLMCPISGISYPIPEPNSFSFNSPKGMCQNCKGLGLEYKVNIEKIIPDKSKSIKNGGIIPLGPESNTWSFSQIKSIAKFYNFDIKIPISEIPNKALDVILFGDNKIFSVESKTLGVKRNYKIEYEGIVNFIQNQYQNNESQKLRRWAFDFMDEIKCEKCDGSRLKKESLFFLINKKNINEVCDFDLDEFSSWISKIEKKLDNNEKLIATEILKEIKKRINFLLDVGLDYLTLNRSSKSLSGGESQRIRLATQIGSQLVGVLYILDEPSIGLHQRDNIKLINSLKVLRDLGNSVIVVEHDKEMIVKSDFIIDIGPRAGIYGGEIISIGDTKNVIKQDSITSKYLRGIKKINIPKKRRNGNGKFLELVNCNGNNLKSVNLKLPLGLMVGITGVSGSGKSSLINQTLYPILSSFFYNSLDIPLQYDKIKGIKNIDKVVDVNQSPIGRTPRSNPATYTGVFTEIRLLFSSTIESKIRGYKPGRFSFNVSEGRCEECMGAGIKTIDMNFLPDVHVECDLCLGKRFNSQTLEIKYKNKSIFEILNMTIEIACDFFKDIPKIFRKLKTLKDVGLGYLTLGQPSTTISGGEAQRVKLASELSKKDTGNTLFILDEPTTGLHFEDIRVLLEVLNKLVEKGNTVVIIEHNLDVIKQVDYIIDIGPEGGKNGGKIICNGTPEEIIKIKHSYTSKYLKKEICQSS